MVMVVVTVAFMVAATLGVTAALVSVTLSRRRVGRAGGTMAAAALPCLLGAVVALPAVSAVASAAGSSSRDLRAWPGPAPPWLHGKKMR